MVGNELEAVLFSHSIIICYLAAKGGFDFCVAYQVV